MEGRERDFAVVKSKSSPLSMRKPLKTSGEYNGAEAYKI
jgi:hypothetical protein